MPGIILEKHKLKCHAQGPDIAHTRLGLAFENLGRHEVRRALKCSDPCGLLLVNNLSHAKIRQLRIPVVQQNILRLHVPVDDSVLLHVLEGQN